MDIPRAEYSVLGELLRQTRVSQGLTQERVAACLGAPQSFISKYESAERRLDILELRQVCACINISLPALLSKLENALAQAQ